MDDKELVQKARKGDASAFKALVEKYESRVAATVIGMIGNTPEAEDIGQEAFIRFYKSMNRFRGDSSVGTYLIRIAINLTLNEIRRRKRRKEEFFSDGIDHTRSRTGRNPGEMRSEAQELVRQGLQKLDPKFRTIVVLRLLDGYTAEETARILKLPTGTVLSRLARAQMKLRDILAPMYGGYHEK